MAVGRPCSTACCNARRKSVSVGNDGGTAEDEGAAVPDLGVGPAAPEAAEAAAAAAVATSEGVECNGRGTGEETDDVEERGDNLAPSVAGVRVGAAGEDMLPAPTDMVGSTVEDLTGLALATTGVDASASLFIISMTRSMRPCAVSD